MEMKKVHIGLFRQLHPNAAGDIERETLFVESRAKYLAAYYKFYARNLWDVQARGYVLFGTASTSAPHYGMSDIKKFMDEHDMDGFNPNYFMIHGGYVSGACGQAMIFGNRSAVFSNVNCGTATMIHELGHNFGAHHASTIKDSRRVEYGDSSSDMGAQMPIRGINSPHMMAFGFETEREKKIVTETQQLMLCPIEMNEHGMHLNEYQHAIIQRRGGDDIHLSLRKNKGVFYSSGSRHPDALNIHAAERSRHSLRYPDLHVGESRVLENGTIIEYLEHKNETARVNIIFNEGDSKPKNLTINTDFPELMPSAYLNESHAGAWHDPIYNRQGIQVRIHDGKLVMHWYTYNSLNFDRRFYYAEAPCNGTDIPVFDIYTTTGGTWADPTKAKSVKIGKGRIYYLNGEYGIFNFNTTEHGRGNLELRRVAEPPSDKGGVFSQKSRDGEGINVDFYRDDTFCVAMWYSYSVRGGEQRWYEASGELQDDGTYDLTIYEYHVGRFMFPDNTIRQEQVGKAILSMPDKDSLTFDFNLNSETVKGKGVYNLSRIF